MLRLAPLYLLAFQLPSAEIRLRNAVGAEEREAVEIRMAELRHLDA
jgi:hypothetical protein